MRCGGRTTWRSRERTPEQRRYLAQLGRAVLGRLGSDLRAGARRARKTKRARRSGCRSRRGRPRSARPSRACSSRTTRAEEQTARASRRRSTAQVQRQVYWFLPRRSSPSCSRALYLIRSNRRLFAELASLSDERRELAQNLIAAQESTLRQISRELHDEFGQILTAIGSMLGRAGGIWPRTPRCTPSCARSARSRRRRSTTSAACRRRCIRRSSTSSGWRARSTGTCRPSNGSSASPSPTSGRGAPCPSTRTSRFTSTACCRRR